MQSLMDEAVLERPFTRAIAVDEKKTKIAEDAHNGMYNPELGLYIGRTCIVDSGVLDVHGAYVKGLVENIASGRFDDEPEPLALGTVHNRRRLSFGLRAVMPALEFSLPADDDLNFDWDNVGVREVAVNARRVATEEFDVERYPEHVKTFAAAFGLLMNVYTEEEISLHHPSVIVDTHIKLGSTVASKFAEIHEIPVLRKASHEPNENTSHTYYTSDPLPHDKTGGLPLAPISRPAKKDGVPDVINMIIMSYAIRNEAPLITHEEVALLADFFNRYEARVLPEAA